MNPTQLTSIFEPTRCPEGEQLKAYADNVLDLDARHAVERHLEGCPLCSDAVEGFALVPVSITSVEQLRTEVSEVAMAGASAAGNSISLKWWMGAVAVAIVGTATWWFLSPAEPATNPTISIAQTVTSPQEEHFIVVEGTDKQPEPLQEAVSKKNAIPTSTVVSPIDETQKANNLNQSSELPPTETASDQPRIKEVVPPAPTMPVTSVTTEDPRNQAPVKLRTNSNLKYIENYKTVNYEERDNTMQEAVITSRSTSPQFSNEEDAEDFEPESLTFQYSYDDVLELGIFRLKAGKYRKALQKFDLILTHFPEDENALFYGGLAHYNLGQSVKAGQFFDLVLALPNSSFNEEAGWYKALSLLQSGNRSEAKTLMLKIAAEGGFYGERATKKAAEL